MKENFFGKEKKEETNCEGEFFWKREEGGDKL